jgi:hypothetical protein
LRSIDEAVPAKLDVHLVMDNYGTQVERWFATLTQRQIRRGTHRSTMELEQATRSYLVVNNRNPILSYGPKPHQAILYKNF